jgi:hypothetical protein
MIRAEAERVGDDAAFKHGCRLGVGDIEARTGPVAAHADEGHRKALERGG